MSCDHMLTKCEYSVCNSSVKISLFTDTAKAGLEIMGFLVNKNNHNLAMKTSSGLRSSLGRNFILPILIIIAK